MPSVRPISIDELDRLGIDEENNLYWDGKPIVIRRRISLPWFVNLAAVGAATATIIMAVVQVLDFLGWRPS